MASNSGTIGMSSELCRTTDCGRGVAHPKAWGLRTCELEAGRGDLKGFLGFGFRVWGLGPREFRP